MFPCSKGINLDPYADRLHGEKLPSIQRAASTSSNENLEDGLAHAPGPTLR